MARSWVLAALAAHLLVLASAAHLSDAEEKDRYRLEEEPSRRRIEREVNAPAKISCELSSWAPWSSCQPCQGIKHRSRSVVHFGQFGGRTCTDILSDEQRCPITGNCEEEPVDCGNDFQCADGHCVNRRLKCNDDNDCGDFSDEDDCETVRSTCSKALETLEVGRTAGSGMNILGMKTRRNPFDNNLYNGRCESVYDGHRRARIRIPWNINTFNYETHAQQVLSTEIYESSTEVVKTIFVETTSKFNIGLSLKLNKLVNVSAGVRFSTDNSKSYSTLLSYLQSEKYEYFRVKGQVQMANFNMRRHHYELDRDFVTDLKALPTEYEKGVYFNILEDYGTHYTSSAVLGGDYQLVYVLDTSEMRKRSVTTEQVKNCLGFSANLNVQLNLKNGKIEIPLDANTENCKNVSEGTTETTKTNRLIKDVVSFVAGGDIAFLTKLNVLLSERSKLIDASVYADWAGSLINSPVLLKPKLIPIHTLVPLSMNESVVIRRNLERATHDYEAEFSVCKCQPCMNGGTVVLLDGQCHCLCTLTFRGMACQIPKARHEERAGYTDGQWDCWSSWRPCTDGQQRRSRQCRGRQGDGADCLGESTDITHC